MTSALYTGTLAHARSWPVRHAFRYAVCMLALDLDELPELSRRLRLFSYNRPNVISLYDRDYQHAARAGVAATIRAFLREQGAPHEGRIVLLTHPRFLGYVFNPVSFFYCLRPDGTLAAVVAEVNNTFGDTHRYLVDPHDDAPLPKLLHVSPFMDLRCSYRFRCSGAPAEHLGVGMTVARRGGTFFAARLSLRREPLTDARLAATLVRYPFMTAKVTAAIHWQALLLWSKGAPFRHQPPYDPDATRRLHADLDLAPRPHAPGAAGSQPDRAGPGAAGPGGVAARPPDPASA